LKGEVHLWVDRVHEIVEIFLETFDSFLSQTNMFTSFPFWKAFCRCFFRIEAGFGKRNKGWGECERPSLEKLRGNEKLKPGLVLFSFPIADLMRGGPLLLFCF